MEYRTGVGYDIHRLVTGRKLVLGGVEIPHNKGLDGHSDADVLIHAVCDALLGAMGKGDIGELFPNTDPQYKNISSMVLLKKIKTLLDNDGFKVMNVDTIILAEEPNLKNYKHQMKFHIAYALVVDEKKVNVKATTMEGLGPIGNKEGVSAWASVLLMKE